jgi:hypothetical protein
MLHRFQVAARHGAGAKGHIDQSSSQIERGATVFVIKKEGGTGSGP